MDAAGLLARHTAAAASEASSIESGGAAVARDARLDPKLVAAAHTFEASLMQELLKPLNASGAFGGDEDDNKGGCGGGGDSSGGLASPADGSGGALMSFGSEALARALSEKGGLGIARRILDHFETTASASGPDANMRERAARAGATRRRTGGQE